MTFIAELNRLQLEAADVGNAYLEATTNRKYVLLRENHSPNMDLKATY